MPETAILAFHFLRPWWLVALVPLAVMLLLIRRNQRADLQWGDIIAPHLLKHLVVTPDTGWRIQPAYLVAAGTAIAIVALAGPSWRREVPPFVENKSPLMIALAVSPSMNETDVQPSRLERGKQKIRDLLAARTGARTALIAFAGSAHLVMPLTDDAAVIAPYLAALSTDLMPVPGQDTAAAVALAATSLATEQVPGTILIVADDPGADPAALHRAAGRNGLVLLRIASPGAPAISGLDAVLVTADASDIATLERRIESHYQAAQSQAFGAQWRDEGFWLVFPVLLLGLVWFRRGTTVQWMILLALLLAPGSAQAEERSWFRDLWLTPDQQGRLAFDRGDYADAKQLFADPMWRGIAAYRAYDFIAARDAFRKVDTIEGRFALGNAEAQNHAYEKAIKLYQEVLTQQPNNVAAKTNLAIVRAAFEAAEAKRRQQEQNDPDQPTYASPDAMKVDRQQKGGKRTLVKPEDLTTPGAAEAWMREVQTSPESFLKLKFAIQAHDAPAARPFPQEQKP